MAEIPAAMESSALLIVDVQYDFLPPDGTLAVDLGGDILQPIVHLLDGRVDWKTVVASMDYHPPGHVSFASSHPGHEDDVFSTITVTDSQNAEIDQILWPDHCIQGTRGCEIHSDVQEALQTWKQRGRFHLVQKGTDPNMDAYSAFASPTSALASNMPPQADGSSSSPLTQYLCSNGISTLVICGIATDVCVKATVLDAVHEGFEVVVIRDTVRGVKNDDSQQTLKKFANHGSITVVQSIEDFASK